VTTAADIPLAATDWAVENRRYLLGELEAVRLRLHAEVLRQRAGRGNDPLASYRQVLVTDTEADSLLEGPEPESDAQPNELLEAAAAELARVQDRRRRCLLEAGAPPALDAFAERFALTSFERAVVCLAVAPEIDPGFERLFGYVQDDLTKRRATVPLALALYGDGGLDWLRAWDAFLPDGVLGRFALVSVDSGDRSLRIDPRVCDYMLGVNRIDERAAEVLRPVRGAPLTPSLQDLAGRVALLIGNLPERARINLLGPKGSGKRSVARAAVERLGLQLQEVDSGCLPGERAELSEVLKLLEREAVLLGLAFYIDADKVGEGTVRRAVDDAVARLDAVFLVGSTERWPCERELLPVRVPKPDRADQQLLWREALGDLSASLNGGLSAVAEQFDLGPAAIARAVEFTQLRARLNGSGADLTTEDLWAACREQTAWALDELAQRIDPCHEWRDIVLPDDVFAQLREIAAQVANRARVYGEWGFGAKLSRGRGITALFAGASGTGKTLAAEILARELELDLYRVDLAGVVSKYIGETEKNLRRVFAAAEESGAVLFFDEADALFGKRSEVRDSHDRYANIEINYLLQRMEAYSGFAVLATNMKSQLDQAFARRIRFVVDFPFPDSASRRRIWAGVFPREAVVESLDFEFLSRLEIAGGNIKNIAVNAAFLAAAERTPIRMTHVMRAARREYAKIPKLVVESEFGPYHEAVSR
jgi:adenylate kinase family enzyme